MPKQSQFLRRLTVTTLSALALLGISASVATSCRSRAEAQIAEARRALAEDRLESAARLFREVALSDPAGPYAPQAQLELARIHYLRLRDIPGTRDLLVRLLEEHPDSDAVRPARWLLATLYARELDEPERALAHYRLLLDEDEGPDERRRNLLAMADCYYSLDQLPEARTMFRMALALPYTPETEAAYLRLARLEQTLGAPDSALELLSQLEAQTEDGERRHEAIVSALEILIDEGRLIEARERLRQARAIFPHSDELQSLQTRLREQQETSRSLAPGTTALLSLQERIRWGAGRRRRRAERR